MEYLAPGMRRIGKIMRRMPGASVAKATPEQIARNGGAGAPELFASILMGTRPAGVTSEDRTADGIPIRVYTPAGAANARPLIVYFHGGGFVFGDLDSHDELCRMLSTDENKLNVEIYRVRQEMSALGVGATPSFFINGRYLSGAQPADSFAMLIDEELLKANQRIQQGTSQSRYYQEWVLDRGEKKLDP